MKFFVAALLFVAVSASFEEWKAKHGMTFTPEEEAMRSTIYYANVAKISSLQQMKDGAQYGVNEFAHLTADEFRATHMGLRGTDSHGCPTTTTVDNVATADAVDWRAKGAVTPVKNQGACGSCWAFSTTGDVEGTNFLATGKLVSLSEQDLVDCDHNGDQGCNGGLPTQAFQSIIDAGGIETEADYPYEGRDGTCTFDKSKVAVKISNYTCLPPDEAQMAAYIEKNGPVSIGINANTLQFYMGGIADPWDILCSRSHLDHGVLIVGFGTENNKDYWIVKNSWGTGWGEKGYFRIIRGTNKCGLANMVSHSIA
jgi:cathepsin F